MAKTLADDYDNKSLSSYVKWLDITRPGSNYSFDYLTEFIRENINIGQTKNFREN